MTALFLAIWLLLSTAGPLTLDAAGADYALFSTPAPCVHGQDEPVIAVHVTNTPAWQVYFDDARFVSGVDGCHYRLEFEKPVDRLCLAWPDDLPIAGVWLHIKHNDLACWQRPAFTYWLPR